MSNAITQARSDVKTALESISGLQVHDFIPAKMTAPAAIVAPGTPYVVPGQVLGEYRVTLNVRLFVKSNATNEVISKGMDDLIVSVCGALNGFGVAVVSQPGIDRESYDTPHLVTDITITTHYREDLN